jgi:tRNA (cytidine/uridine-2'-O-)-methyltransferase
MHTDPNFNVVLYQPEIPQNTGNIGRLCVGTACRLHLVEPLGFDLNEKKVRRAGLDYWSDLDLKIWPSWSPKELEGRFFLFTKSAERSIFDIKFQRGDTLVFGCETQGLPREMVREYSECALRLPQFGPVRSQNLSNCVSAAIYLGLNSLNQQNLPIQNNLFGAS